MKVKKLLALFLGATLVFSSTSVLAASSDVTDEAYYTPLLGMYDFEDQTTVYETAPTTPTDTKTGAAKYYIKENGNIYWYGYRAVKDPTDSAWDNMMYNPTGYTALLAAEDTVDGTTDRVLVVQNKVKFTKPSSANVVGHFVSSLNIGNIQLAIQVSNLTVDDNNDDKIYIKSWGVKIGEQEIGSYNFKSNNWYQLRQTYHLKDKKYILEIVDQTGATADYKAEFTLPAAVGDTTIKYDGKVHGASLFYTNLNTVQGCGYALDDVIVAQLTHKPVTVSYDNTKGTVTYNGADVVSEAETPVPYNSAAPATFTVTAKDGYEVEKITVNGAEVATTSVDFTNVTEAQTMSVTFKEKEKTAPTIVNSYEIDTDETMEDGSPAALLYSQINSGYGYTVTEAGAMISDKTQNAENGMKLIAKTTENQNVTSGMFGIRVYGKGLENITAYMTPFVTYEDAQETKTAYGTEEDFTLTK